MVVGHRKKSRHHFNVRGMGRGKEREIEPSRETACVVTTNGTIILARTVLREWLPTPLSLGHILANHHRIIYAVP